MKGLWNLTSRAINPGLGMFVFDTLVAHLIIIFTCIIIVRRSKQWPEAWTLQIGMLLLSSWSVLHLSDVVVHFGRSRVSYGYIIVGCLYKALRMFSDVFVISGTWSVLVRYNHLRPNMRRPQRYYCQPAVVAVLLLFLGVYQICLMFALSFAWLSFSDLDVINAIAKARSGFEIAFTALAFVSTCVITARAEMLQENNFRYRERSRSVPASIALLIQSFSRAERLQENNICYRERSRSVPASIALLIRSFCEVVIVGELDRWPASIQTINRVRDVTYGLFSVLFVGYITFAIPKNGAEDPLAQREEIARGEVKALVIRQLAAVTEHGRKTAPTIPILLEALEREEPLTSNHMKRVEIDRLKALYVDWEPIYKLPGEDGD